MRILVMLKPTNKRGTKMAYTRLRKFLISDGYTLWGPEIFMRVTTNRKSAETHMKRLRSFDPGSGIVRVLRLTEKQFKSIWYLTGEEDQQEQLVGSNSLVMI